MSAPTLPVTTRVFKAGNSLAVRIPKGFDIREGEATIEQRGGGLFITDKRGDWASFFTGKPVDFPFTAKELRHAGAERTVDTGWVQALSKKAARKTPKKRSR